MGLFLVPIGLAVVGILVNVLLLLWVAKDAKARGMDNVPVWILLVAVTGVVGLIVYICVRTQGNLVPCPSCHNNRLEVSRLCPHCGNA
jgi:hypothetical protein